MASSHAPRPLASVPPSPAKPAPVPTKAQTGAEALIRCLEREGVEYVFGLSGGAAMPIFDALVDSKIKLILVRHEQGATHMADGYARSTGKPGVVLVTSGPGATNTVTGLLTALMDSCPMIVLTGQTISPMLGKDAFQEADVTGITYPVVKHSYLVKNPNDIPRVTREAFHLATSGRPGPVLIDLPKDVTSAPCTAPFVDDVDLPGYIVPGRAEPDALKKAAALIAKSRKPVLYVGHGAVISGAGPAIMKLAEKLQAPIVNTLLGKGACAEDHPAAPGHARHARHRLRQQGGHRLRHDHGDRRALGRPHHGQAQRVLRGRDQDPHRHRPRGVQQDRAPGRVDRRRREAGDRGAAAAGRQARHRRLAEADRRLAQAVPAQVRRSAAASRRSTCSTGSTTWAGATAS